MKPFPSGKKKPSPPNVSEHLSVFYCLIRSNDEGANAIPVKPLLLPLLDRQLNVTLFRINVIH